MVQHDKNNAALSLQDLSMPKRSGWKVALGFVAATLAGGTLPGGFRNAHAGEPAADGAQQNVAVQRPSYAVKSLPFEPIAKFSSIEVRIPLGGAAPGKIRELVLELPPGWVEDDEYPIGSDRARIEFREGVDQRLQNSWIEIVSRKLEGKSFDEFCDEYQGKLDKKKTRIIELGKVKSEVEDGRGHSFVQEPSDPLKSVKFAGLPAKQLTYKSKVTKRGETGKTAEINDFIIRTDSENAMILSFNEYRDSQLKPVSAGATVKERVIGAPIEIPFAISLAAKDNLVQMIGMNLPKGVWTRKNNLSASANAGVAEWGLSISQGAGKDRKEFEGTLALSTKTIFSDTNLQISLEKELDAILASSNCSALEQPHQKAFKHVQGVALKYDCVVSNDSKITHLKAIIHVRGAKGEGIAPFEINITMSFPFDASLETKKSFEGTFAKICESFWGFTASGN